MKRIIIFITIILYSTLTYSQLSNLQLNELKKLKKTDDKVNLILQYYSPLNDSAKEKITKLNEAVKQFENSKDLINSGVIKCVLSYIYLGSLEDYASALRNGISAKQNFEQVNDSAGIMRCAFLIGSSFQYSRNFTQAIDYFIKSLPIAKKIGNARQYADFLNAIADCFVRIKKPGEALPYVKEAIATGFKIKDTLDLTYYIGTLGEAYLAMHNYDSAKAFIFQSLNYATKFDSIPALGNILNDLSHFFYETNNFDSAIYYARKSISSTDYQSTINDAYEWLYKSFEKKNNTDSSLKYFRLATTLRDSLFSKEKNGIVQSLNFQQQLWEKEKEQELIQARKDFNNKLTLYISIGVVLAILIIAMLLYRNNKKQKEAKLKVEEAYSELKSTQAQLIQSEKMASLGELTAGIAHEIQNPLNFVNNFSEVNKEMVDEATEEIDKGNYDEVKIILSDIKANEEKINHHGKRADAIVKGMLQHSRQTSGKKEATDINALCDEYLRLSYHGLRAKDKEFNAEIKTDFDNSIGKINIVPQDIGRVLLNLFNNAFYAVNEKKKLMATSYQPINSVQTRRVNDKVEIIVSDNGNGIPQNIIDKIFQPFFTTKPTGSGTGLGLSLSYDIITKEHGGTIKVESKEGDGSAFIIQIPNN